jgi:hypothetical protein
MDGGRKECERVSGMVGKGVLVCVLVHVRVYV